MGDFEHTEWELQRRMFKCTVRDTVAYTGLKFKKDLGQEHNAGNTSM
jgi:hypothetical protein